MKIRFTEDRWLKSEDLLKVPKFKKGSTHDLSEASAYRWVRRSVAVYVVEEEPTKMKVGRPMMDETRKYKASEVVEKFSVSMKDIGFIKTTEPKKVGRPKKGA